MPWPLVFGSRISYLFSPLRYYVCFYIDINYQTFLVGLSRRGVSESDKERQNSQGHQSNHTGVVNPWTISGLPAETLEQTISEVLITRRMTSCFSRLLRKSETFLPPIPHEHLLFAFLLFHTLCWRPNSVGKVSLCSLITAKLWLILSKLFCWSGAQVALQSKACVVFEVGGTDTGETTKKSPHNSPGFQRQSLISTLISIF